MWWDRSNPGSRSRARAGVRRRRRRDASPQERRGRVIDCRAIFFRQTGLKQLLRACGAQDDMVWICLLEKACRVSERSMIVEATEHRRWCGDYAICARGPVAHLPQRILAPTVHFVVVGDAADVLPEIAMTNSDFFELQTSRHDTRSP